MSEKNSTFWLKLFGWAMLCHVILIALSFIEVFIYSVLINPGQEESVYTEHAQISAPYVAIIFGVILFFFLARYLTRKRPDRRRLIALYLPIFYIIVDLAILIPFGVDWGSHFVVFILSFGTKMLAAFAGAYYGKK